MVLLATLMCQLRKQPLTVWIFFRDLLNNETRHRIVAGQNTVSLNKGRTLAHTQTNRVHSSCQPFPISGPPTDPGDCARPAGVKLYRGPTSQNLIDTCIDGARVHALIIIYGQKPSHAAFGTSFKCFVTIPGNLQDSVIALLVE